MKKILLSLLFSLAIGNLFCQNEPPLEVIFSLDGGFYDSSFVLTLHSAVPAKIYFTEDGSHPSRQSKRYREGITIDKTKVIRAIAYHAGDRSPVSSHTFFIKEIQSENLPTLSVSIDPWRLFDSEDGLFMLGSKANTESSRLSGANFWSRKELSAGLEFYETDGSCVHNSVIGLRLFGGISRLSPQKSLALVARESYGDKKIRHRVFGKSGPKSLKYLVLRNSGSDFGKTHVRDALITQLAKDWEVDVQAYRPAHVYINGQYWGIYNLREKINRHFLADHHDVDKDSLDLLEHHMTLKKGSRRNYQTFLQYLKTHDLSIGENYKQVKNWIEVESFMDWQIAQIFFDNRDAGGNIRYWRPQTEEGRWRWVLFDMDWGMGLHSIDAHQFNSLAFHSEPNGPSWPNPPWSTFVFRKLLENEAFQQAFITRFSDYLNQDLSSEAILHQIDVFQNRLEPEMNRHLQRWNLSQHRWNSHFNRLRDFGLKRGAYVHNHLQEYFDLDSLRALDVESGEGGRVLVNRNLEVENELFAGTYFEDFPVHLRAEPHLGYRFKYWENESGQRNTSETLLVKLKEEKSVFKAVFEKYEHPMLGKLLINEIAPNNRKSKDWLELYNNTDQRIALGGYVLRDAKNNAFEFPKNAYIAPNDYLIICQNKSKFLQTFPMAYNVIGDLGFGLNKHSEQLEFFDNRKAIIDSVAYLLPPSDSTFSWGLLLPHLNNEDNENWKVTLGNGTPNAANPYHVESSIRGRQSLWMRLSFLLAFIAVMAILIYHSWVQEEASGKG